jgi:hypothetical protein
MLNQLADVHWKGARRLATVAAFLALLSSSAFAADLHVPRTYRSIEQALDASRTGDRVIVSGGRHSWVTVDEYGVSLIGRGGATLVGQATIVGDHVTLSGFRFAGDAMLVVRGDDAVVTNNRFRYRHGAVAVDVQGGARARIEKNRGFRAQIQVSAGKSAQIRDNRIVDSAIQVFDDGALIEGNSADGLTLHGNDHVVQGNRLDGLSAYDGRTWLIQDNDLRGGDVYATGEGVALVGNRLGDHVQVHANDASLIANETRGGGSVTVYGEGVVVRDNELDFDEPVIVYGGCGHGTHVSESGLIVEGDDAVVEDNEIDHDEGPGVVLTGDRVTLSGNDVSGVSSGTSLAVYGVGGIVADNHVAQSGKDRNAGNGIDVAGDGHLIRDNHVQGAIVDAIVVSGGAGNVVTGDVIQGARGTGVNVTPSASTTLVEDCTIQRCNVGVVNQGPQTSVAGSTVGRSGIVDLLDLADASLGAGNKIENVSRDAGVLNK